ACDGRTGTCVAAEFDCATLATVPEGTVVCDPSRNYYTACTAGQPQTLACGTGTKCATDGSLNCYTEPTDGVACGGPAVCYPGMHCIQGDASGASCDVPAGVLACSSTDVLAVCTDVNTGFACVKGAVWRWQNLTTWGGSCTSNHANIALGGVCIPGLADCLQGLECHRSVYDVAGVCRTPAPNAPAECALTGQASTGRSCIYDWHSCRDGKYYDIDCRVANIGGQVITVCDCSVNGVKTTSFGGDAICNVTSTADLDMRARASCGWTVTTTEVAP
nr:hypothetical protein [Deltaproteobacteria bacterium]